MTNGTATTGRAAATLLAGLSCPGCGGSLAMYAVDAPRLTCTEDAEHGVDLAEARELAAGWAVAVRWMEATAEVLDGGD